MVFLEQELHANCNLWEGGLWIGSSWAGLGTDAFRPFTVHITAPVAWPSSLRFRMRYQGAGLQMELLFHYFPWLIHFVISPMLANGIQVASGTCFRKSVVFR